MINKILFATTNKGKLTEAQTILDIEVEGVPGDVPEIQSLDPKEVAVHKAQSYFELLKKSILIEDLSFIFKALGKLPGPYVDDFLKSLGNEGLIKLLDGFEDRRAEAITTLVYCVGRGEMEIFTGSVKGVITSEERGEHGFGWDAIFVPDGENRTFAQMTMEEKNKYSMRAMALKKFRMWLDEK